MVSDESTPRSYEHARRTLPNFAPRTLDWQGWRLGRPLVGFAVGFAIVALFLAIRGGASTEGVDELTGTQRGGWNRLEDVHLLIVVNIAIVAAIAVTFLAEWVHRWTEIVLLALVGGTLLAIREITDAGATADDILLGLVIACGGLVGLSVLDDLQRLRRRNGY